MKGSDFVLRMAWRDSRSSRRRLVLFSLSVVLGIAALVVIGSLAPNLQRTVDGQIKGLVGGDIVIVSSGPMREPVQRYVDGLGGERSRMRRFFGLIVFPKADGATREIQGRAIDGAFPLYGDFTTEPRSAVARLRKGGQVAVIDEDLMQEMHAQAGDEVKIGKMSFTIIGALKELAGDPAALFRGAPRVLIPFDQVQGLGLTGRRGSFDYRTSLKLPDSSDPKAIVKDMHARFPKEPIIITTPEDRRHNFDQVLERLADVLSLVGFIALFLGAIGMASTLHVHIRQKIATVAILRCLGASARQSFSIYLIQGMSVGACGAFLGAVLGVVFQYVTPALLRDVLPIHIEFFIVWPAILRGAAAGLVICFLFALLPLLTVRRISPLAALRSAVAERGARGPDPWQVVICLMIAGAVVGFALLETRHWQVGLGYAGMLAFSFGVFAGTASLVAWVARRWVPGGLPYVVRQGLANLHRPNNRTVLLLLSLGLGTFLMVTLYLTRTSLLRQYMGPGGKGSANLIFFNIGEDERAKLPPVVAAQGGQVLDEIPEVAMKLVSVNGKPVGELTNGRGNNGLQNRDFQATYRDTPGDSDQIVDGKFVGRVAPGTPVIPISMIKMAFVKLGDEIVWDVDGVPIRTKVASIHAFKQQLRFEPNAPVIFPLGALDGAPKNFVVTVRVANPAMSARVQSAVAAAAPGANVADLVSILRVVERIMGKLASGVQVMVLFIVATGVVMLGCALLTGRRQRIRETILLRTLGASRRQLIVIQAVEYAVLGILAAVVGCLLAILGHALLSHYVFKIPLYVDTSLILEAVAAVATITLVTGLLSNRGVASHPPLEVLRQET